jgi:hypothetical protein
MIVFSDHQYPICPALRLDSLAKRLSGLKNLPPGISRHAAVTSIFIDAAELAQGISDNEFARRGQDALSPLQDAAMALVMLLARAVHESWQGRLADHILQSDLPFASLAALKLPDLVTCRRAEGYAFYAVYPECYLSAATMLENGTNLQIIGIRSIGLGLAALVAAAAGASRAISLRPFGNPFRRSILVDSTIIALLFDYPGTTQFAIADEGPGLSGSSFGAVIDLLVLHGVPEKNIHVFPGHSGDPGWAADGARLSQWRRLHRHVRSFEQEFLVTSDPSRRLDHWFSDVIGKPLGGFQDLSAGRWRSLRYRNQESWPPAHLQQERRKYLLQTESGLWLLKFTGLDRGGRRKLALARLLHEAGFGPETPAMQHGFMVQRWHQAPVSAPIPREPLLKWLASYLGFRARHFAGGPDTGASLPVLTEMLMHNATEAFGPAAAAPLERFRRKWPSLSAKLRPIATDNRLHSWEWIMCEDGPIVKADAVDHCSAHDLIGCQDVAWDIAGAIVELALTEGEREDVISRVERISGEPVSPELVDFLLPCYLAFQLGYYSLATAAASSDPAEAKRLRSRADYYRGPLEKLLFH